MRKRKKKAWSAPLKALLAHRQGFCCARCGLALEEPTEVDHFIPLARNGSNAISNLRLVHRFCNRQKGDKLE